MVTIISEIEKAKKEMQRQLLERDLLLKQKEQLIAEYGALEVYQEDMEKARIIIQNVALEIQQALEYRISHLVSLALASVFEEPYQFHMEFVTRRNQSECDMFFVKNGNQCEPMDSSGGGALDIAALALRMAIWSIKKTRALQILDEPCRFLSRGMQIKASQMIKTLSEQMGIQVLMVSHIPEMIESADRVFKATQCDGTTKITVGE